MRSKPSWTTCSDDHHPHPGRARGPSSRPRGAVCVDVRGSARHLCTVGQGLVRGLALGLGVVDPALLLRHALGAVGRPPGPAVRPGGAALLHPGPGALPAGPDLPGCAAGDLGAGAVLLHRGGRPPVVRLHLPADGLHRDLHVGRAPDRGRPHRPHAAGPGALGPGQTAAQGRQAGRLAGDRAVHRLQLRRLLHADPRAGPGHAEFQRVALEPVLGAVLRRRHLRQCGLSARADVQVHLPLCALPERADRPGLADHHLRHGTWRAAWLTLAQGARRRPGQG